MYIVKLKVYEIVFELINLYCISGKFGNETF